MQEKTNHVPLESGLLQVFHLAVKVSGQVILYAKMSPQHIDVCVMCNETNFGKTQVKMDYKNVMVLRTVIAKKQLLWCVTGKGILSFTE